MNKPLARRCASWAAALCLLFATPALAQDDDDSAGSNETTNSPASTPIERVFLRSAADTGALAQQYPHLAVWLEPEDAPRVLGLVERETTARPEGAMIILAGEGQSANHALLEGLRSRLSEAGWATMTLGLEAPSPSLQMARERLAANARAARESGEGDEPVMIDVNDKAAKDLLEAHRQEINGRLAAAVDWFAERDYQRMVLVGVGRGADEVSAFLGEAPSAVRWTAWIAADFGGQSPEILSRGLVGGNTMPILDMYSSRGAGAPVRAAAFRRSGVKRYEPLAVPVPVRPAGRDAGAIANRLLGWLGQS